jgi:hypothetical protein
MELHLLVLGNLSVEDFEDVVLVLQFVEQQGD